jgi:hypothetical protein
MRRLANPIAGTLLSFASVSMMGSAAYLGGHISFASGAGVGEPS